MDQSTEFEYVGFWARIGASLIDTVLQVLIVVPALWWIYGREYFLSAPLNSGPVDIFFSWVLPALLVILFWILKQATPGKMLIGAMIVDARTGGRPSIGQFIGRYLAYFISSIPLCFGFIWIGFDKQKQGWHDKLAGTVVIRKKSQKDTPVHFENPAPQT